MERALPNPHPLLKPVLEETLGTIVFQEQVIEVAMALSGFSSSEAEGLRRAMSRKRSEAVIDAHHERFIAGAEHRRIRVFKPARRCGRNGLPMIVDYKQRRQTTKKRHIEMNDAEKERIAISEAAAEMAVLTEFDGPRMFAIELKPQEGQTEDGIKEAVERCLATGWIEIGPASHYDPRTHLTAAGRAELASRQRL